jgi:chitodextrinase
MPSYRLVFPVPEGTQIESARTAIIQSDKVYSVGDEVEHGGKRWRVSQAPLDDPIHGETPDLRVWPVD